MAAKTKAPQTPKTNVELATFNVTTATAKLEAAKKALEKVAAEVLAEAEKSTELVGAMAHKAILEQVQMEEANAKAIQETADKIAELEETFAEKQSLLTQHHEDRTRSLNQAHAATIVDLELKLKQFKVKVVEDFCKESGKTLVEEKEFNALLEKQAAFEKTLDNRVAELQLTLGRQAEANLQNSLNVQELEHKAVTAELVSENKSLATQLASSKAETQMVLGQLNDLRNAMIEMQKANSQSSVNVYSDSGKK